MIIIGLGSNVGDRLSYLGMAVKRLSTYIQDIRVSSIVKSAALLPVGAPADWDIPFLNMALVGRTALPAHVLIRHIKTLEFDLGRTPCGKWGPREIDIDILAMNDEILNNVELTIPHRELLNRDFALLPLCELAPDWRYPLEGAYCGWKASAIARDKGFCFGAQMQRTEFVLHV